MELTAIPTANLTPIAYWLNTTFASFDLSVAQGVHSLYEILPWFFTPFFSLITLLASPTGSILICVALTVWPKTRRYGFAMLVGITVGVIVTNLVLKPLVLRPRPYSWEGSLYQEYWHLLGEHMESDYSFPSGHTTAAVAMAVAMFLVGKNQSWSKAWIGFVIAFLIAVSRIYLSVHYCTDVLAGVLCGIIGGFAGSFISFKMPEKFYTGTLPLGKLYAGTGQHMEK